MIGQHMTSHTAYRPLALDSFDPSMDRHALVTGGSVRALRDWVDAQEGESLFLARWAVFTPTGRVEVSNPYAWADHLEALLTEISARAARGARRSETTFVVVDVETLTRRGALPARERRRALRRVNDLIRLGGSARVHVIAVTLTPTAPYRLTRTIRSVPRFAGLDGYPQQEAATMTATPASTDLSDFTPERDGHALVLGAGAHIAVRRWLDDAPSADTATVVLGILPDQRRIARGIHPVASPTEWDGYLETVLGEVARRYSTALASVIARRLYVVIDLDPIFITETPTITDDERDRVLERLEELLQIGRAAAVHVVAIAKDPATTYRISNATRGSTRTFLAPEQTGKHR